MNLLQFQARPNPVGQRSIDVVHSAWQMVREAGKYTAVGHHFAPLPIPTIAVMLSGSSHADASLGDRASLRV
ncbi:hypothetical protein [Stappia sp. ES.058]|uniref:hypothetical protein n=1 Tax=Stappia sp. ES.058 TaxID=1881061 RepID=UPI000B847AC7|nr:hypothetical protein [Stappia sp. ES.058]